MDQKRQEIENMGIEESAGYKNLVAVQRYAETTRQMFQALQKENQLYRNQILELGKALELLRTQMSTLQVKVYSNKPTA
tara:strand:+ start:22399 stop:22635 length:237 start_codon:yes stop_codon:yes gene_type:complete